MTIETLEVKERMRRVLVGLVVLFYAAVALATVVVDRMLLPRGDLAGWSYYIGSYLRERAELRPVPVRAASAQSSAPAESVPVLVYHGVVRRPDGTNVSFERFVEHLEALVAAGYRPVGLEELEAFLEGRSRLPSRPVVITFDDARRDQYRNVDLVLERLGLRAVMFVPTRRVLDADPFFLSWPELERMHRSGRWEIGCHGRNAHDPIPTGPSTTGSFLANRMWLDREGRFETLEEFRLRIRADHRGCRADLESHIPGLRVRAYAFPLSDYGQLKGNDPRIAVENLAALRDTGFTLAFWNTSHGFHNRPLPPLADRGEPILVGRLRVSGEWTGAELVRRLRDVAPR